jgi:hypothetical protein
MNETGLWTAATSPDGHALAFYSPSQLTIVNAASGVRQNTSLPLGDTSLSWSPDERCVALDDGASVLCVRMAGGAQITIPLQSNGHPWIGGPYGWLDATHLLVDDRSNAAAVPSTLDSLDTTSGGVRRIATISIPPDEASFALAPGGMYTLASDAQYRNAPFTPVVDLINNASGATTPLPRVAAVLPALGGFTQVLWRPGATQAIAATGFPENGDLRYFLIDVTQDTTTPLNLPGFPEAWSPDGSTLIVATGGSVSDANGLGFKNFGSVGSGPYHVSAVTVDALGHVGAAITLTSHAMSIPLLGFVRTA